MVLHIVYHCIEKSCRLDWLIFSSPFSFELYKETVYGDPHPPLNSIDIVPLFKQYVASLSENSEIKIFF